MTDDSPRIRLRVLGVVSFSLLVALIARLWFLQVLNADAYEQQAVANTERVVKVDAPRGRIFDRNGKLLVDNRIVTTVSIDKAEFERALGGKSKVDERAAVLTRLAVDISESGQLIKVDDIERRMRNSQYSRIGEVPIALDVDDHLMVLIGEHPEDYPGVKVGQTTVRYYPYGGLAAHVLGYVGPINDSEFEGKRSSPKGYDLNDEIGKAGIEQLFEDVLRGTPGTKVYEVDRNERVIQELSDRETPPEPGQDIHLTIDINIQNLVEIELRDALIAARTQEKKPEDPEITAPAGAAVLLDPQNGSVIAMASYPTYEPADFIAGISDEQFEKLKDPANYNPILNRAIQGEYAPGSTFKPFTAYGAIEKGFMGRGPLPGVYHGIDDDGTYELRPCQGEKCDWSNSKGGNGYPLQYRNIDLPAALTVSSDTYFYAIGAEVGRSQTDDHAIQDAAAKFGLGSLTGVQLPGERAGRVADRELKAQLHEDAPVAFPYGDWFIGDNINAAVGQGLTVVTPLQLANAYAALGNGGTVYAPKLVTSATDQDTGEEITSYGPGKNGTIDMAPSVRDPILQGLVGVTSSDGEHRGTGYTAFHDPIGGADFDLSQWPVAGKTGTAQVIDAQGVSKADTALFAAFGPALGPDQVKYAMAVVLEQSGFGGLNAAPVVAKVFDAIVENRVKQVLTVPEVLQCQQLLSAANEQAATTTTTPGTTTTTTAPGATTTTVAPPTVGPDNKPCA